MNRCFLSGSLFSRLPRNRLISRLCKRYLDQYNGENNDDMATNGELRFLQHVLPKCSTVFDVGSNVGDWGALALSVNPRLSLHCFEPSSVTFQRLLAREFPLHVICNNFGLSSRSGAAVFHVFMDGAGINSLYQRRGLEDGWGLETQQREEVIRLEVLDQYCVQAAVSSIDFLKVDVEGHELDVFKGAAEMLSQGSIKRIQFEYGGCNIDAHIFLKDFFEFFQPFAYTFFKIMPYGLRRVDRYDQRLENFNNANWAVIRKDIEQ
jgi:FkbM family methyltransferase